MNSAVRTPAVAGRFYPGQADELLRDVREYTSAIDGGSERWPRLAPSDASLPMRDIFTPARSRGRSIRGWKFPRTA